MDEECVVTRQEEEWEPTVSTCNLTIDLLCCCIVQLLEGNMMGLHLSGSQFDGQTGRSLLFHLFGSFYSSTPDVWRHDSR